MNLNYNEFYTTSKILLSTISSGLQYTLSSTQSYLMIFKLHLNPSWFKMARYTFPIQYKTNQSKFNIWS